MGLASLYNPEALPPAPIEFSMPAAPTHLPKNQVGLQNLYSGEALKAGEDGNEHSVVYNDDGDVLLRKDGKKTAVDYTPDEQKLLVGARLTHNHPSESSLNGGDLASAQRFGQKSVSAVTPKYVYSLETSDGKPFSADLGDAQGIYQDEQMRAMANKHGRFDWPELSHEVMQAVARRMGLKYERRER